MMSLSVVRGAIDADKIADSGIAAGMSLAAN